MEIEINIKKVSVLVPIDQSYSNHSHIQTLGDGDILRVDELNRMEALLEREALDSPLELVRNQRHLEVAVDIHAKSIESWLSIDLVGESQEASLDHLAPHSR